MTASNSTQKTRKRIRLTPDARREKILESALMSFSRSGFVATRIEDIASGAGLSKSGFYAHFDSKEDVFNQLLTSELIRGEAIPFSATDTVEDFIERLLDVCYGYLGDERRQMALRIVFSEAHRVPELVYQWWSEVAAPESNAQIEVLRAAIRRKQLEETPLLKDFTFAYAPFIYWVLANSFSADGRPAPTADLATYREIHREMLKALLRAPIKKAKNASGQVKEESQ